MAEESEEALSLARLGAAVHESRLDGLRFGLLSIFGRLNGLLLLGLLHLGAGLGLVDLQVLGVLLNLQQGMRALQSGPQGVLGSLLLLGLQSGFLPLGLLLGQLIVALLISSLLGVLLPLLLDSGLESRFLRILHGEGRGISLRSLLLDSFDLLVVGSLGGELFGLLLGFLGGLVDDLSLGVDDFS